MARITAQKKFGNRVKELRKQAGLNQEDLAELSGLSRSYISDVETGRRNPSIKNVAKLAKGLRAKLSDLTDL